MSTREGSRGFLQAGFPSLVVVERIEDFGGPLEHLLLDNESRRRLEKPRKELLQSYSWRASAQLLGRIYRRQLDEQTRLEPV